MKNKALTLTVVANMTSNYGEGLGNVGTVQKVYKNGKAYAIRSRESMKNAIMVQSGLYDDLKVEQDGKVDQKAVSNEINVATNRALEGGYMSTIGDRKIRKSSFYMTDAISFYPFVNEVRFYNNLYLAQTYAKENGINIQEKAANAGLMPYQYEYDKSLKRYSITIDLDKVGIDENYETKADDKERADRVKALINAVKNLSLVVRGNMDNAEPIFVVGGIGEKKTHYFENVVHIDSGKLKIEEDLKAKLSEEGYGAALLKGYNFENEREIEAELGAVSIENFFAKLSEEVDKYYESSQN